MSRISPSSRISEAIEELLRGGLEGSGDIKSAFLRLGYQRLVQEALEQEVKDFLGRDRYERDDRDEHRGYRNGYKERSIRTAEGAIPVYLPQVRQTPEPFHSQLWAFLKGNSDVLEYLVAEMYARGLSTRDIEDIFTDSSGHCLISRTGVSRLTEVLWEEYEAFARRDLSGFDVAYLFLDAVYEPMRRQGRAKEGILCAWAILTTGEKVMLHMALGNKESYTCWLEFLRDMVKRGLQVPLTITSDGAPGLLRAVEETWPLSLRVRCWVHKMANVLDKVPDACRDEVKAFLVAVRDAPDYDAGRQRAEEFIARYQNRFPSAVKSFEDDLQATLNHLKIPVIHRKFVRTTNLLERSFGEERRRTKVIPRFFDEKSALKLAFAALWRASQRWRGVKFTEIEQKHINQLRKELGIPTDHPEKSSQSEGGDTTAA